MFENLEQLNDCMTIEDLCATIIRTHQPSDGYIPAIIEEGNFSQDGKDFYSKLVLVESNTHLYKPFLTSPLSLWLPDSNMQTGEIELIFNLITQRNYRGNNLYQLNPLLSNSVMEEPYEESRFVHQVYSNTLSPYAWEKVLKAKDTTILCLTKVFEDVINELDSKSSPKYYLVSDFEFRNNNLDSLSQIDSGVYQEENYNISISRNEHGVFILGSVRIPFKKTDNQYADYSKREIVVIDLVTHESKKHNPSDLSNDTELGIVCFDPDVIGALSEYYHIFGLTMHAKNGMYDDGIGVYLLDLLYDEEILSYDKVVFWEGEYNKLPTNIKDKIDKYNIRKPTSPLISKAMASWQLDVDWDYIEQALPNQQLADKIAYTHLEMSIDYNLSFLIPDTREEFYSYINTLSKVTNIEPKDFGVSNPEIQKLNMLFQGESVSFEKAELYILYQKYSYNVLQRLNQ